MATATSHWSLVTGHFLAFLLALSCTFTQAADSASAFFALNTGDLKTELSDARREGKRALMLFFEQEGCPGCLHMKKHVFPNREVQAYYEKHFSSLALDIHGSVPFRDLASRELSEKGYAQAQKVRATPTFVFHDLDGREIVRIVGPLETPEEFLLLGRFVVSGAYKSRTFAQYRQDNPIRKGG